MSKPMLPIGVDSFNELIRYKNSEGGSYIFIDKTLFIKDFIDTGDKIVVITRPRRFGKTINLSMLEHFFASEVNGIPTKGLFDNLKISKNPKIMEYQGSTPVIFITLKEIRGKTYEEAYNRLKCIFTELFEAHLYLLQNNFLTKDEVSRFEKYINKKAKKEDYERALKFLSTLLFRYSGTTVYIFLDEYDTPLNDAYVNEYYEEMRSFMAALFNATFKGNNFLKKALITGIIKIAKSSLFSELNNVEIYTTLADSRYAQYFGFTEEETDDYLDKAGLPSKSHELKEMYNGYQIEHYTLYNPFSVVLFIKNAVLYGPDEIEKSLKPYWVNTGGHTLVKCLLTANLSRLQQDLTNLINNQPIKSFINENIIMGNQLKRQKIGFWSLLLMAGYLKSIKCEKNEMGYQIHTLVFPNKEIRESMRELISETVAAPIGFDNFISLMQSLLEEDIEPFEEFLEEYIKEVPSYFDTKGSIPEQFYHGLLLGISASLYSIYNISSNRESGEGRYDIALEPKDKNKKGIIIELKSSSKKNEELRKVAEEAYTQILSKGYKQEMASRGIKEIIPIGIAFSGKEVKVKY